MTSRRAAAGWFGLLLLVVAGLYVAGRGALQTPGISSSASWSRWMVQTDPVVAAFALMRLFALVGTWYLLAVSVVAALVRLQGGHTLVALADRLTLPVVRRLLAAALSAGIATGGLGTLAPGAGAQDTGPPPTMTMHRLTPGETPSVAPAPEPAPALAAPREWRVEPGQCFWTIADGVLAAAWGHAPSDAEIVPYWRRLIEANRGALSDPDNPDLIFPGQVFTLPPI
jgi:hypothetical protein